MLDHDFDLIRLITVQRHRAYDFGDILVARATTRMGEWPVWQYVRVSETGQAAPVVR